MLHPTPGGMLERVFWREWPECEVHGAQMEHRERRNAQPRLGCSPYPAGEAHKRGAVTHGGTHLYDAHADIEACLNASVVPICAYLLWANLFTR